MAEYFIDYYSMFSEQINREMTESEIKKRLSEEMSFISQRLSGIHPDDEANQKSTREIRDHCRKAIKILSNPVTRREYDIQLDAAVKAGKVNYEVSEEVKDILARAHAFFEKGRYDLALNLAKEALDNKLDSEETYELISRSYFMLGDYDEAVDSVSKAAGIYQSSLHLRWLNIRFLTMTENFNEAQAKLNEAMRDFDNDSMLAAEQIYLYGYAERFDMLKDTIDSYISRNPNDMNYRRYVAHNLIEIAQQCYVYDSAAEMLLLTEEESYNRCLELVTLANTIFQDEYVQNELEYVKEFGEEVFDDDHKGLKRFYRIGCILLILFGIILITDLFEGGSIYPPIIVIGIGVLFQYAAGLVDKCSYRPYWKVYRDTYRGFKEHDDGILYNVLMLPWEIVKQVFGAFFGSD